MEKSYKEIDTQTGEEVLKLLYEQRQLLELSKKNIITTDETLKQTEQTVFKMTYPWWNPKYWYHVIKFRLQKIINSKLY